MPTSAGLLLFRRRAEGVEVLLAHPGGPIYARKDLGAWSLPKGLVEDDEQLLETARREFWEETGFETPEDGYLELGHTRYKNGKWVYAWAFEGDCDPSALRSNSFEMEWPPRSGRWESFPEVDRVEFFSPEEAAERLHPAQVCFVTRLLERLIGDDCTAELDPR